MQPANRVQRDRLFEQRDDVASSTRTDSNRERLLGLDSLPTSSDDVA